MTCLSWKALYRLPSRGNLCIVHNLNPLEGFRHTGLMARLSGNSPVYQLRLWIEVMVEKRFQLADLSFVIHRVSPNKRYLPNVQLSVRYDIRTS